MMELPAAVSPSSVISGHKTRSVFDRYNIVSERDLHEAARRLDRYVQNRQEGGDGDIMVTVGNSREEKTTRKSLN